MIEQSGLPRQLIEAQIEQEREAASGTGVYLASIAVEEPWVDFDWTG